MIDAKEFPILSQHWGEGRKIYMIGIGENREIFKKVFLTFGEKVDYPKVPEMIWPLTYKPQNEKI